MKRIHSKNTGILDEISGTITESQVLTYLDTKNINNDYINEIKKLSGLNDDALAGFLNISVRTFHSYMHNDSNLKANVKEPILLLLYLIKHGLKVFVSKKEFETWLNTNNFYFDGKKPSSYLNKISGIRFVDDRLTAMEFGDNV